MAIIVNGGSDPARISYNGVNLTAVCARQGQSGSYVQVWPSQFTVRMTGERVVEYCDCDCVCPYGTTPGYYYYSCDIAATATSDYQLNGNPPTTVSSWSLGNNYGNVTMCGNYCFEDEAGCDMGEYNFVIPSCMYTVVCCCLMEGDRTFCEMFPNNFTGSYTENLSDGHNRGWSSTQVRFCCKPPLHIFNMDGCGAWNDCWRSFLTSCIGNTWSNAHSNVTACFTNKCFRIQANMANGQTYRTAWCPIHDPPMYCDTFTFTPV